MRISYSGREHLDVTTTDSTGGTLDITFDSGATWHPAEIVDSTHARVLVAGPGATDNPVGTIVLEPGRYPVAVRLTRGVEEVIRDAETVLDVVAQIPSSVAGATCIPSSIVWNLPGDTTVDPQDLHLAEVLGWTTFQSLTGYSVAICPIEVRPCRERVGERVYREYPVVGSSAFQPALSGGAWVNCACGDYDGCSCGVSWVDLPGYIGRIDSVTIDGVPLPKTAYRVEAGSRLIRQDGGVWPDQDLSLPAGQPGTWTVRYFQGDAPTEVDSWAAGILAAEFLKAMNDDKKCRLPSGVTNVVRNGVTIQLAQNLFLDGTTGIREVDAVIAQRNPHRLAQPPRVASPDSRRSAVTTWSR